VFYKSEHLKGSVEYADGLVRRYTMNSSRRLTGSRRTPALQKTLAAASLALCSFAIGMASGPASADEAPNRIRIEYQPPKSKKYEDLAQRLKANQALEKMQEMFGAFRLPNDLNLILKECGMANAWYQRPTVTICYEYVDDIQKGIPKGTHEGITQTDAILGQFIYVVAHEMGHALFDSLNVPLFGAPEEAADEFATYMMLLFGKEDARRLIQGAAYGYKQYLRNPKVTVPLRAFSDAHGAPMQRFYDLLCFAYGADQETFGDLVEHQPGHVPEAQTLFQGHLPEARARACRVEFGELNFAFKQLIRPHMDPELEKTILQEGWLPDVLAEPDVPPPPPEAKQ
jgi:hypothetical protein